MYQERLYRGSVFSKFTINAAYKESDLLVSADKELDVCFVNEILKKYYHQIEDYAKVNPSFITSLSPLAMDNSAPQIVKDMLAVSQETGIGPFASVAGAVAFYVGNELLSVCSEVIVENGGDIFLKINESKKIGVYLGPKFMADKNIGGLILKVQQRDFPFGIASSSSVFGHSLNFGAVDLLTVIAKDSVIADGFATALSNRVKKEQDIVTVMDFVKNSVLIEGILIAFSGKIYLWGDLAFI